MFNLNPLDVLHQRELKVLPPHFSKIKVSDANFIDNNIKTWISNKLKGRYCIIRSPHIGSDSSLKSATFVGFEDHKELTYFMLACPYLRRN